MPLLQIIKQTLERTYKVVFHAATFLPVKKNVIMFESFLGKQYSCNPRALYEYLKTHHPEYKMYWSVDRKYTEVFEKHNVPYLKRFSFTWLFQMARAQFWVSNSRLPLWIPKPNHTTYLQTWHGTPLKKLAQDMTEVHMPGTTTEDYKKNFSKATRKWDYLISPNPYSSEIFKSAFEFKKTMVESGYPRNDFLYTHNNEKAIEDIKKTSKLPLNKKIILYAPTWRDNQYYDRGKYKFDLELDLQKMQEQIGEDYIILLRMHYLVAENLDLSPYKGFAYDFSKHEDIRELYLISDLLITDYSSVFFDYANLKRPMIFFAYDIENYRDQLRGFYFDFNEVPGPIVQTTDGVLQTMKEFENNHYAVSDSFYDFYRKFCSLEDGLASKRVVEKVFLERITQ